MHGQGRTSVVFDVMVLVRAVVANRSSFEEWPSPPPRRANAAAECVGIANDAEEFALWVSPHILRNTERVLVEVFAWAPDQAERYINRLREVAKRSGGGEVDPEEVSPGIRVTECPDFEDNRILELASVVDAYLIVSNDEEHLTPMSPWRGTPIIIASEFVARVDAARRARRRRY
ncbi:MAG: PIN domain-containing protein [Acidimicrobiales bacterium]